MKLIQGLKKKYGSRIILIMARLETIWRILARKYKIRWLRFVCSRRWLSWCHATFFTRGFRREIHAVLCGRYKHLQSSDNGSGLIFTLRRNIHRLEKGLLMRPRRAVFALSFIQETVDAYNYACSLPAIASLGHETIQWASDVLQEYFMHVQPHPVVMQAKRSFVVQNCDTPQALRIPQTMPALQEKIPDTAMLRALCCHRKSVRWFMQKTVPRNLLDQAFEIAALAPSACNRQPYRFVVIDDPQVVQEIVQIPAGTAGYAQQVPVFVVVVGDLSAYFSARDRHVLYVDGALASMTFMLALETVGLSSCPINWPDIEQDEQKMDAILNLNPWERPIIMFCVGYADPDGCVAYSQRKSLDEIRCYQSNAYCKTDGV